MHKKLKYGFTRMLGVVAEDKTRFSKWIEVYPFEMLPFYEGDINSIVRKISKGGVDASGKPYVDHLARGASIRARWAGENNRWFAPDVREGELVEILYYRENEEYHWLSMGRDNDKRRGETVTFGWDASGAPKEEDIQQTLDNCYTVTVNTVEQRITLKTSMVNGEAAMYTLQFDCAEGRVSLQDNEGNIIQLDTVKTMITLLNKDGTFLKLEEKNIEAHCDEDFKVDVGNDMDIYVGNDMRIKVENDQKIEVGNNRTTKIGKDDSLTVGNNRTEKIGNDDSLNVGNNRTEKVGNDGSLTVGNNWKVQVSTNANLQTGGNYTVMVGGSWASQVTSTYSLQANGVTITSGAAVGIIGSSPPTIMPDAIIGGKSFLGHMHAGAHGITSPPL